MTSGEDKKDVTPEGPESRGNSSIKGRKAGDSSVLAEKTPISSARISDTESAAAAARFAAEGDKPSRRPAKVKAKATSKPAATAEPPKPAAAKRVSRKAALASQAVTAAGSDAIEEKSPALATATEPQRKRAAGAKPRAGASSRARAPGRAADTRSVTHKAATPKAEKTRAPQPTSPIGDQIAQAETDPSAVPAPTVAPAATESATITGTTAAFVEAAFGQNSNLPGQLVQNIERIEALTQRLMKAMAQRRSRNAGVEAPGPELYTSAAAAWLKLLAEQPARVLGQQVHYWGETLRHVAESQSALARGQAPEPSLEEKADRRFQNPLWTSHPFFSFVKRQYQINAEAMEAAAAGLEIEDQTERRRIDWFTRQIIDMMAPTNFLATNPDALEKAVATEGESLVKGLENLVRDVEEHGGEIIVSLADRDAFRVGENIGTTEGTVVARAPLYELIQYKPTTDQVHAIPVVIFPPWINKFYILDLKPQNSLIKWIVDQGYSLFVVAWRNPDTSFAQTGMDDYVSAYLEVMDRIQDLTGEEKVNAVGYCIAGTTLALTLALLKSRGIDRVNSATFFTTLTDFAEQGEFTTYLQDDFVSGIEDEVRDKGVLSSALMTRTFSFLRANDLVWAPAIRSYMLGEAPPAFDLLFWNGDGTNLPGRMAVEYLRGLCQKNAFAQDGFTVLGQKVHLSDVLLPICAIACETDHIAPWRDSWRGIAQMGSTDRRFILSQSGHIAGIINPPSKKKYGHYTSDAGFAQGSDHWLDQGQFHEGSWWAGWSDWLKGRSGGLIDARDPGKGFGPAPGSYVHERPR